MNRRIHHATGHGIPFDVVLQVVAQSDKPTWHNDMVGFGQGQRSALVLLLRSLDEWSDS